MTVLARLPPTMPGMASRNCRDRSTIGPVPESLLAGMVASCLRNRRSNKLTPPRARSPLCGRRTRGRPSWEARLPSVCPGRCPLRARRLLRHRSNHISGTSRYACSLLSEKKGDGSGEFLVQILNASIRMGSILLNPIAFFLDPRQSFRTIRPTSSTSVSSPDPTLVLFFGPFDPSGSGNLPADAVTCASLGGHALSVVTAIHVQDTASIEDVCVMTPEFIDDQARCLLEDMNVQAIKAGPLYSTDAVRVLAQIAADYSQLPLVLQLGTPLDTGAGDDNEPEDVLAAIFELLLPQANLVMAEHGLLAHWQADGILPVVENSAPAM